jgi:SAM-dependent methyltransferase
MMNVNRQHWDSLNRHYDIRAWTLAAKRLMAAKEINFIKNFLQINDPKKILDIGVGNGRILSALIKNSHDEARLSGIDISPEMIKFCKEKFGNESKLSGLIVADVSDENFTFDDRYSFISAIRVLKYNKNWRDIIGKIAKTALTDGGIFIFTMPNRNSINKFAKYKIPFHRASKKEIMSVSEKNNLKILKIKTFTRVPDIFYEFSENSTYIRLLLLAESLLEYIFGASFLGRILFIAVQKDSNESRYKD